MASKLQGPARAKSSSLRLHSPSCRGRAGRSNADKRLSSSGRHRSATARIMFGSPHRGQCARHRHEDADACSRRSADVRRRRSCPTRRRDRRRRSSEMPRRRRSASASATCEMARPAHQPQQNRRSEPATSGVSGTACCGIPRVGDRRGRSTHCLAALRSANASTGAASGSGELRDVGVPSRRPSPSEWICQRQSAKRIM